MKLSPIDAPSRNLWVAICTFYSLLVFVFAIGIWLCAYQNKRLVLLGALIAIYAIRGFFWPPMHQREIIAAGGATFMDSMHIVFAFTTILLMMFMVGLGAATLGRSFHIYIGNRERINIGIFLIWIIVLAIVLGWENIQGLLKVTTLYNSYCWNISMTTISVSIEKNHSLAVLIMLI